MTYSLILICIYLFFPPLFFYRHSLATLIETPQLPIFITNTDTQICSTTTIYNQSVNYHLYLLLSPPLVCIFFLQTFVGKTDENTPVTNIFQQPIQARYIRIRPSAWKDKPALRIELIGCRGIVYSITTFSNVRLIVHNLTDMIGYYFVTQNTMSYIISLTWLGTFCNTKHIVYRFTFN